MPNKILSQEEIDALLKSVSTGDDSQTAGIGRKKVSLYDFKHPNLISKEQQRLLDNIHEELVREFMVFLSAQLRMIVDIHLLAIDQIMYSEFVMSITPPAAIYVGNFDNPYSEFVLEMNPLLVIFIVERLFGGTGKFISSPRPISVIEKKIMGKVVDKFALDIAKNWKPIKEFNCEFNKFETKPEFVQIIPASEPVVVVSLEIKLQAGTTLMNICYPYRWISEVISKPEAQEKVMYGNTESTTREQIKMKLNVGYSKLPISAILGRSNISIGDFVNLKAGDIIQLDSNINDRIEVHAGDQYLYTGNIGQRSKKYAIKISSIIEKENNSEL